VTKLNQLLAAEIGARSDAEAAKAKTYHQLQKGGLFSGLSKTYDPVDDADPGLPPEYTRVQLTVEEALGELRQPWARLITVVAQKDLTNTEARADVIIGDSVIIEQVPATYLLFLEKTLVELATLVGKIPLLDPAEDWDRDDTSGWWKTPKTRRHRTQKQPKSHVLYEATPEHPAQVQRYDVDEVVGFWDEVKFSGAMKASDRNTLLRRVRELQDAVRKAREEANMTTVVDRSGIGEAILNYVFDGTTP
jgi:hypothetical protein